MEGALKQFLRIITGANRSQVVERELSTLGREAPSQQAVLDLLAAHDSAVKSNPAVEWAASRPFSLLGKEYPSFYRQEMHTDNLPTQVSFPPYHRNYELSGKPMLHIHNHPGGGSVSPSTFSLEPRGDFPAWSDGLPAGSIGAISNTPGDRLSMTTLRNHYSSPAVLRQELGRFSLFAENKPKAVEDILEPLIDYLDVEVPNPAKYVAQRLSPEMNFLRLLKEGRVSHTTNYPYNFGLHSPVSDDDLVPHLDDIISRLRKDGYFRGGAV